MIKLIIKQNNINYSQSYFTSHLCYFHDMNIIFTLKFVYEVVNLMKLPEIKKLIVHEKHDKIQKRYSTISVLN